MKLLRRYDFALNYLRALIALGCVAGCSSGGTLPPETEPSLYLNNVGSNYSVRKTIAVLADGSVVIPVAALSTPLEAALVKLTPSGELDAAFGAGGIVQTPVTGLSAAFYGVTELADGTLVATGMAEDPSGDMYSRRPIVARYRADGTLDTSFGDAGIHMYGDPNPGIDDVFLSPVALGERPFVSARDDKIAALAANGDFDPAFGAMGLFDSMLSGPQTLAIQSDGKLVTAGFFGGKFAVVRVNVDGTTDASFGSNGMATADPPQAMALDMDQVAVAPDGKILVVANWLKSANGGVAYWGTLVHRFNVDGTPDMSFGASGKATSPSGPANSIAALSDGRVAVGPPFGGFTANGEPDASFSATISILDTIAALPDGRLIVSSGTRSGLSVWYLDVGSP